ncbi:hypothetical protein Calab_0707 [Caldithrix abyssi DSM 13497]|uniref:Uncharacterized protein n=1 Tax=Caldithrix abyssi DSM 13497 TaxID=880073 RepID=H1XTB3_CALAY|nr:hypothetical protein [Caldithrix abyssi]APF20298.1 hypothetical protein Cabys_3552 [Caldithrix abyssi DSM 13497]EHO40346.1 hypothetical protein Calab_0707 [Caldithrix abyssi DSM 13497]
MNSDIKSGKQILDEFFQEIQNISDIDEDVIKIIIELYNSGKLSDKNLSNALLELREKANND